MGNTSSGVRSHKGVRYDANGNVISCVFCRLGSTPQRRVTKTYHDGDDFLVIESRTTYARQHLLVRESPACGCLVALLQAHAACAGCRQVIPKHHVKNTGTLRAADADMVRSMEDLGRRVMQHNFGADQRFVFHFHNPPFNSVDHLHLHCFMLPFNNCFRALQNSDTFCWTSDVEDTVRKAAARL